MIRHKQLYRHNPPFEFGDCHRTCLAAILELPVLDVPNICAPRPGEDWETVPWIEREREFLRSRGYSMIRLPFDGGAPLIDSLRGMANHNPDVYWILGGTSRNGTGHSVIVLNDAIVHDPSLDDSGIVGPMSDGYYRAEFIGAAIVCQCQPPVSP